MVLVKQKRSSRGTKKTIHRPPLRSFLHSQLRREKSIWAIYNDIAGRQDNQREREWSERTDTMLLFSGIFATVLSGFLIALMTELKPDNVELTVDILKHISNQMHNTSYGPYDPDPSNPDSVSVVANWLFFSSLAFVLLTAFLSMRVKTWIRDFERDLPPLINAEERAKERESRFGGLIRYQLPVVMALPIMIQIALVLFWVGLLVYLRPIQGSIFISVLSILVGGLGLYLISVFVTSYDSSVPFTSILSRALAYPWHVVRSSLQSLWDFHSTFMSQTAFNDETSQKHSNFMFLRRVRRALGFISKAQGAGCDRSLDAEVRIMNRIARETLVTPESVPIFIALAERLALDNQLRPCSASEWQEIIATFRNTTLPVSSLGKRGLLRIMTDVYEEPAIHQGILGELAREWLLEYIPSSGTRMNTRPGIPSGSLPLLAVLTVVPSTLGEMESLFSEGIEIKAATQKIQKRRIYEAISLDLSWLQVFLRSKLVSDLGPEFIRQLTEQTTRCLQETLIVASFFPTVDCSLLIRAVVQVALARERNDPHDPRQSAEASGNLFTASPGAGWPSNEPLDLDDFFNDFVAFMSSATNPQGVNGGLAAPLFLALQRVDQTSSLYGEHHLNVLITALPEMANRLTEAQKPLTHLRLMEIVLAELPRKEALDSLGIFLGYWNHFTKKFSKPLDQHTFDLFDALLSSAVGNGPGRITGSKKQALVNTLGEVQNPWLRVHIHNIFGTGSESIELPYSCDQLREVIWGGHSCHERIVERVLDLYDQGKKAEPQLLVEFSESDSFRSYIRCIDKEFSLKPTPCFDDPTSVRLGRIVRIVLEREVGEDMEADWFAIAEVFHPLWLKLPADWKESISKAFRSHNRFIDWLQRSMTFLDEQLHQGNPDSGSTIVIYTVHDRQRLERAVAAFLPFIWHLLSAAPSLTTAEEANKLAKLNLKGLPDAFGDAETRSHIEKAINSPDLKTAG